MKKTECVQRCAEEVTDILCNLCGESCRIPIGGEEFNIEAVEVSVLFGYGSSRDGEEHEAHLCQACYETKLLPLFAISPLIGNYC